MKRIFFILSLIVLTASIAFASSLKQQDDISHQSVIPYLSSPEVGLRPELYDLKINIEFLCDSAFTTYDMIFYNPDKTVAESDLIVPLKENQNIAEISYDIDGKIIKGIMVEKKENVQFIESVHPDENIIPSPKKSPSKNFTAKIYPIEPDGMRRVKVILEEPLTVKEKECGYELSLNHNKPVDFDFNVEIPSIMFDSSPSVKIDGRNLEIVKGNNLSKASFSKKKYELSNTFRISFLRRNESYTLTHKNGKNIYFYADLPIKSSSRNKNPVKNTVIFWDSSLSGEKRDIKRELLVLDAYFKKNPDTEAEFISFNIKSYPSKKYVIKKGDWSELKKDILRIFYDGALRTDCIKPDNLTADEILLFTSADISFGKSGIAAGKVPIITINSSKESDCGTLALAALKSGGSFIDLCSVSDKQAAEIISKQKLKIISYSFDKDKFKEIYPAEGSVAEKNFILSGVLTARSGEILLSFGYDKNNIVFTKKVQIDSSGDNPEIERFWAKSKIKKLELEENKNRNEILNLAKKYFISSKITSIIIPENPSDYVKHKAKYPPEFTQECATIEEAERKNDKKKQDASLEDAVMQAQEIKDWWRHDYAALKNDKISPAKETYLTSRETRYFTEHLPAASEGEVKAPSPQTVSTELFGFAKEKSFIEDAVAKKTESIKKTKNKNFVNVRIKARDPQVPYMKIIQHSFDDEIYSDYLKLKAGYGDQPSFYFDIADELASRKMKDETVTVLSNIAAMKIDSPELLRVCAYKFMEIKSYSYAVGLFEKIVKIKPEDPQSYRDLALAYQANKEYKKALKTFYKILTGSWERFHSIKQIAFVEMNNLISLHPDIDLSGIDKRLIFSMPVDIRIVLSWSTDDTDIDIYVTEPSGEKASYADRFTNSGGRVSEDLTQGFGPEEYMIKKSDEGKYEISTDFYGDDSRNISGPTVLYLDIYTFYGTKNQTHKRSVIRTENVAENDIIGSVDFKKLSKPKTSQTKKKTVKKS